MGRYLLVKELTSTHPWAFRWLATDRILRRTVEVHLLIGPYVADAIDVARRAALVRDARLVHIIDAGHYGEAAFVLTDEMEGTALPEFGSLEPEQARTLAGEVATVLDIAREIGVFHLTLRPELIHLGAEPHIIVGGLGWDGALWGSRVEDTSSALRREARDTVALLYTALTGHWPGPTPSFAPPPPDIDGSPMAPSQLAGWIPDDLDTLCRVSLARGSAGPASLTQVIDDLGSWHGRQDGPRLRLDPRVTTTATLPPVHAPLIADPAPAPYSTPARLPDAALPQPPSQPIQPIQPIQPSQPSQPSQPIQPRAQVPQPVRPVQLTQPVQPVQLTQPVQRVQSTSPAGVLPPHLVTPPSSPREAASAPVAAPVVHPVPPAALAGQPPTPATPPHPPAPASPPWAQPTPTAFDSPVAHYSPAPGADIPTDRGAGPTTDPSPTPPSLSPPSAASPAMDPIGALAAEVEELSARALDLSLPAFEPPPPINIELPPLPTLDELLARAVRTDGSGPSSSGEGAPPVAVEAPGPPEIPSDPPRPFDDDVPSWLRPYLDPDHDGRDAHGGH